MHLRVGKELVQRVFGQCGLLAASPDKESKEVSFLLALLFADWTLESRFSHL